MLALDIALGFLGQPALAEAVPATWDAALRLIVSSAPRGKKLLLVLDEFQWL